jgi:C4-dicarboxylate transporter DctQ subunit
MLRHLDRIEEYIMLVTFPPMLAVVLLAAAARYSNLFSMSWGEEVARYLMIWLGFAGIGYGFKKNAHLGLSFVVDKCPPALRRFLGVVRSLFIMLFGGLTAWFSYLILSKQFAFSQHSPSLQIPMWAIYLAVCVGGVLIVVRTAQLLFRSDAVKDDGELHLEGQ